MSAFFHLLQVIVAIGLIGLVLLQHGKGADAGAAFGSGASTTVFGSQGSGSFLSRITAIFAAIFFINSLILAYFSAQISEADSIVNSLPVKEAPAPAPTTDLPALPSGSESVPTQVLELPAVPVETTIETTVEKTQTVEPLAPTTDGNAPVPAPTPAKPVETAPPPPVGMDAPKQQ